MMTTIMHDDHGGDVHDNHENDVDANRFDDEPAHPWHVLCHVRCSRRLHCGQARSRGPPTQIASSTDCELTEPVDCPQDLWKGRCAVWILGGECDVWSVGAQAVKSAQELPDSDGKSDLVATRKFNHALYKVPTPTLRSSDNHQPELRHPRIPP
eukprot:2219758-Rhodomonas_salina.5